MTPNATTLSIVICTRNRPVLLDRAIASLAKLDAGLPNFEILIIDNGSSAETAGVIRGWQPKLPNLRFLVENKIGLSHARNRALSETNCLWIAFIDDDVRLTPNWAGEVLAELRNPRAEIICGPIELEFESRPAGWLNHKLPRAYLTELDYGHDSRFLQFPETPFGANMIVKRDSALRAGGFSGLLGRRGNSLASCEEIDFFFRMNQFGFKTFYLSTAKVFHFIENYRMTKNYLRKRVFAQGISENLMARLGSLPKNQTKRFARTFMSLFIIYPFRRNSGGFFIWQLEFFRVLGFFWGRLTNLWGGNER